MAMTIFVGFLTVSVSMMVASSTLGLVTGENQHGYREHPHSDYGTNAYEFFLQHFLFSLPGFAPLCHLPRVIRAIAHNGCSNGLRHAIARNGCNGAEQRDSDYPSRRVSKRQQTRQHPSRVSENALTASSANFVSASIAD
jgi:hypothetical protein